MNNIFFIIILFVILILCQLYKKENFESKINNKIVFELKNSSGLNLVYLENNFYLIPNSPYIFDGILDTNGLYKLQDGIKKLDPKLNFNTSNTSDSYITLIIPNLNDPNNISNIFNQTDQNIYLDPINKILVSNDNSGNKVYLSFYIDGNPIGWNYNIDDAIKFDINYM